MQALTHLFGSVDGYRTLARCAGVADAEDSALAAMGFGSPQRVDEFDGLERSPCMAGRLLPSGRYAITRLFKAGLDVAGRQTVERRTLVLTGEQWSRLAALDLPAILASEALWHRDAFAAGQPVQVPQTLSDDLLPSASEADRRAYDALLSAHASGRCAMLPHDRRFDAAVLRLPRLLPPEEALCLGWGVGLWSIPTGVWLATVRELVRQRNAFVAPTAGAWRHPDRLESLGRTPHAAPLRVLEPARSSPGLGRRKAAMIGSGLVLGALVVLSLLMRWSGSETPVRPPEPTKPSDAAPPPPSTAETPAVQPASEAPAATVATSTAPTTPGPASTPSDPNPGFGSNAAAGAGFGQGMPPTEEAPPAATQAPVAPTPPPSQPPAATPAPAPAPPPSIAPAPTTTAPWDDDVQLLRESVDLAQTITTACSGGGMPDDALRQLAERLCRRCEDLTRRARKLNEDGHRERLFAFDTRGGGPGPASDLQALISAGPLPVGVVQRIALLAARFQLRVAAGAIEGALAPHRDLRETPAWKASLRAVDEVHDWPGTPFSTWYAAGKDTRSSLPSIAAARLLDRSLAERLPTDSGMLALVQELKRAADGLPTESAP